MIDFRPVLFLDGILLVMLAGAMAAPSVVGPLTAGGDGAVFLGCAGATAAVGAAMSLATMPAQRLRLSGQQTFLLAVSGLLLTSFCAAFPLRFASPHLSFSDAWFEAVSGLTTTGATLIGDLDHTSHSVLLWRAVLNWLGGIGFIVMTIVLLPALKIGGVSMVDFSQGGAKSGVLRTRIIAAGRVVVLGYVGITLLSLASFWMAGMMPFDALCHALSAVSTGGFSTSDESLRHWGGGVQWVAIASMIVGASSMPVVLMSVRRRSGQGIADDQMRAYLITLSAFALSLIFWRWANGAAIGFDMVRTSVFTAVSMVTTTGFVVTDYSQWGGAIHVAFFLMVFIGGCVGSASGGIKIFRWQVLAAIGRVHVHQMIYPHRVLPIEFHDRRVTEPMVEAVLAFFVLYILTFAVHAAALAALGLDLMSALSGSAAALGNVGRGVGDVIGPSGNWQGVPKAAKWILSFEMIVGRLELFSVFVLFTPGFWKE